MKNELCKIPFCEKKSSSEYVSAELLLKTEIDEYHVEDTKRQNLNIRTGIFISLISAILIFIVTCTKENQIDVMSPQTNCISYVYWFYGICTALGIGLLLFSLNFFIDVCSPGTYRRVKFEDLLNYTTEPKPRFAMALCLFYRNAIIHNREINSKKTTLLQDGIEYLQYALLPIAISLLLLLLIKLYERGAIWHG